MQFIFRKPADHFTLIFYDITCLLFRSLSGYHEKFGKFIDVELACCDFLREVISVQQKSAGFVNIKHKEITCQAFYTPDIFFFCQPIP